MLKHFITLLVITNLFFCLISKESEKQSLKYLYENNNNNNNKNFKDIKNKENLTKILNTLFKKIDQAQSKKDVKFNPLPLMRFSEIKGLYSSYIHLNFQDKQNSFLGKISRNYMAALDMNMFVTNFVLCSLIESIPYAPELSKENKSELKQSLSIALEALSQFRDKNYPEKVPIYNFWKQDLINGTWSQSPETMVNLVKSAPKVPEYILNFLPKIHLENLKEFITTFQFMCDIFQYAFRIPPDADDTSVNVALTGMLYKLNSTNFFNEKSEKSENSQKKFFKNFESEKTTFSINSNSINSVNNWFNNNSDYEY